MANPQASEKAERGRATRTLKALRESYSITKAIGSRSSKRLWPLHGWLKIELEKLLTDPRWKITAKISEKTKEIKVEGRYYGKKVDVGIDFEGETIGVVSIKYIMSSYGKNAINYFEQQLGETANLRKQNIVYGNIFIVTNPIPVLESGGVFKNWETLREQGLRRYVHLRSDSEPHAPDELAVIVTQINHSVKPKPGEEYQLGAVTRLVDLQTHWQAVTGSPADSGTRKSLEQLTINSFINGLVPRLCTRAITP